MAIDLAQDADDLIPLNEAGKLVPGRQPCYRTLWRWAREGKGGNFLDTALLNSGLFTTRKAMAEFLQREIERNAPGNRRKTAKRKPRRNLKRASA